MKSLMFAALGALALSSAVPAVAQEYPLKGGDFWQIGEITIEDGHFGDYADFLAGQYRKERDFEKSKGWIKQTYILGNVNKRAGEADIYLITITDHVTTPAEDEARQKEMDAFLKSSARAQDTASGVRAKYRKIGSSTLLQELRYK